MILNTCYPTKINYKNKLEIIIIMIIEKKKKKRGKSPANS